MIVTIKAPGWVDAYPEEIKKMANREAVVMRGHAYRICFDCFKVIRLDKPIIGDLHLCKGES